MRSLKQNSFRFGTTDTGHQFVTLAFNESTKKSQGDDSKEIKENAIILSQPELCQYPVTSFKLYMSKLNPTLEAFFQQPNPSFKHPNDDWYKASPVGINTIGKFLSSISKSAGLSQIYTNYSIRGTTINGMKSCGYTLPEIASVTKHKNLESVKIYLQKPTLEDKQDFSDSLFKYAYQGKIKTKHKPKPQYDSNMSDFEQQNTPTSRNKILKKRQESSKKTPTGTESPQSPCNQLVPMSPKFDSDISQNSSQNVMQTYKQNPIGMFVGATLTNCTININMPK